MQSEEYQGITPHLTVPSTDQAVEFYKAAFGADELIRNAGNDGRVFHCELLLNGGRLLLHDDFSEEGETPDARGGSPVTLHLYVADVDAAYGRCVEAGAESLAPPEDTFWGDRYAQIKDPAGHLWSLGTHQADLSLAEHEERADEWSKGHFG